jgi:Ni,Fe-hydrogenase III large subunit/Ni,Fe-hydrogenase III component G
VISTGTRNRLQDTVDAARARWPEVLSLSVDPYYQIADLRCPPALLPDLAEWLVADRAYAFGGLVVEDADARWDLRYLFYGTRGAGQVHLVAASGKPAVVPSISPRVHAADWHEREAEDLFGLVFEGHPRLGDFVLHNEIWPEAVVPLRQDVGLDRLRPRPEPDPGWRPLRVVQAPGAFLMPVGPIYSDVTAPTFFILETVGEDVIRVFPRLFYAYRGVEKIAVGRSVEDVLLLAERVAATSSFAHSLAFCQAVEALAGVRLPARARVLRSILAELERLRYHVGVLRDVCEATALAVAASQAAILEEELLRLSCVLTGHRYLFGMNRPGGLTRDVEDSQLHKAARDLEAIETRIGELWQGLRSTPSFLDRVEEVGILSQADALFHGLVGPVARASGVARDLRVDQPYGGYDLFEVTVPLEQEGDGFARLQVWVAEALEAVRLIRRGVMALPGGPVSVSCDPVPGAGLGWVEAPGGAAFHWVRVGDGGRVLRYRLITPSFTNWHGFHLAAERFAFQDFPIILATFGLSVPENDR